MTLLLTLAGLLLSAPLASAQVDNHLAIGASFNARSAGSSMAEGENTIGFQWRIGHADAGWGWNYALNWFGARLEQPIGGQMTNFGKLRVRPFMAGYGYHWIAGRSTITASVLGGYALTTFRLEPLADDEYRARLGARSVSADVSNTFVVKPELQMWYDIGEKFGLTATAGYLVARPKVTVTSSLGEDARSIRADMFIFKVGLVYSIF